jgi:hypothetical protein
MNYKDYAKLEKELQNSLRESIKAHDEHKAKLDMIREIIELDKKINQLSFNLTHFYTLEKYINAISHHLFFNKSEKKYMKIFDVRPMQLYSAISGIKLAMEARNTLLPNGSLLEFFQQTSSEELVKSQLKWARKISDVDASFLDKYGDSNRCKHLIILQWSSQEIVDPFTNKDSIFANANICIGKKCIKDEWVVQGTMEKLSNSLFGSEGRWGVVKHPKSLKEPFRLINHVLNEGYNYSSSNSESLFIVKFFQTMMLDYFNNIARIRNTSNKFGL